MIHPMDGYTSDLHVYIIVAGLRHVKVLVTLTSFQGHSLVYRISFEQVDVFFAKLAYIYHLDNLRK